MFYSLLACFPTRFTHQRSACNGGWKTSLSNGNKTEIRISNRCCSRYHLRSCNKVQSFFPQKASFVVIEFMLDCHVEEMHTTHRTTSFLIIFSIVTCNLCSLLWKRDLFRSLHIAFSFVFVIQFVTKQSNSVLPCFCTSSEQISFWWKKCQCMEVWGRGNNTRRVHRCSSKKIAGGGGGSDFYFDNFVKQRKVEERSTSLWSSVSISVCEYRSFPRFKDNSWKFCLCYPILWLFYIFRYLEWKKKSCA